MEGQDSRWMRRSAVCSLAGSFMDVFLRSCQRSCPRLRPQSEAAAVSRGETGRSPTLAAHSGGKKAAQTRLHHQARGGPWLGPGRLWEGDLGHCWARGAPAQSPREAANGICQTCFFFFFFLGLHLQHMDVPRLGAGSELRLPAYITGTATPDPSRICDLHCSLRQRQILNPLSEAGDRTHILTDTMAGS